MSLKIKQDNSLQVFIKNYIDGSESGFHTDAYGSRSGYGGGEE
jgi:hypothetical protein